MAIAVPVRDRRRQARHRPGAEATVSFRFPDARSTEYTVAIRDVSVSGLSFVLGKRFPEFEIGDVLREVAATLRGRTIRGEMIVMHMTPGLEQGATCGGLFYPRTDEDLLALRAICRELANTCPEPG